MLYFFLSHYSSTQCFSALFEQAKDEVAKRVDGCVDENSLAMRRAQEVQAKLSLEFPSRVKFMLHSHYCWILLGLPKDFCTSHLPNHNAAIILVDENGKEMETKYLVERHGLSGGWRGFSVDHNLIAGDVLVFQLIEPFKLKVTPSTLQVVCNANVRISCS
nr:B3 domain-containing protein Os01g0234100-like [Ipomoea batatas]